MKFIISVIVSAVLLLASAQARWHEVKSDNFIVSGDANLGTLKKFAIELEQFRVFLAVVTGKEPTPEPVPVEVYLMTNNSGLRKIYNRSNIGGVYTTDIDKGIFAADVSRQTSDFQIKASDIVKHEYVHHYTKRTGPFYYPIWYNEGIADYFASFEFKNGTAEVGRLIPGRIGTLSINKWVPLRTLILSKNDWYSPGGRKLSAEDISLRYAQSWFTTHYLQHSKRAGQLNTYLRKVAKGGDIVTTFEESFEATVEEVQTEIEAVWKSRRLPLLRIDLSRFYFEPELTVTPLDRTEQNIRLALASSYFGSATEIMEKTVTLEEVLATNQEDMRLLYRLALMQFDNDTAVLAQPYVDQAVRLAPNDPRSLVLQGLLIRAASQAEYNASTGKQMLARAREKFNIARKAGPKNPRAHYEYSRTFRSVTVPVTEEAIDAAVTALELSPDPYEVPFNAGLLLAQRGYIDDAVFLLGGLASWASDKDVRRKAKAELDRIKFAPISAN